MSEEKINFRQISFEEAMQMVLERKCGKLYLQNHGAIDLSTKFSFPLEDLRHKKWFRKEIIN